MSAAGAFAQRAAALAGWRIEKIREAPVPEHVDRRSVRCTRGEESFYFTWSLNPSTGNYNFLSGVHTVLGIAEVWDNLKAALRTMAEPEPYFKIAPLGGAPYYRLPFNPSTVSDEDAIAALSGKWLTWINRVSGAEEKAESPANGKHSTIQPAEFAHCRVFNFASRDGGFRAVRLNSLISVEKGTSPCPR